MRYTTLVITFLFVAAFAVGCTSTDGESAVGPSPSETASVRLDKVKMETKEAAYALQDYAYAQKVEFVAKMKKELVKIQEESDRLSAKVDGLVGAAKADAKKKLDAVREKWTLTKKQLDQAENATESTWDDVRGGFKKSYGELKDAFAQTRRWLSEKIEP